MQIGIKHAIGFVCHPAQHTRCTRRYKQCNPVVGLCVAILSYFPLLLLAALFLAFFLPKKFQNTHVSHLLSCCHNQRCVLSLFSDQPAFSALMPIYYYLWQALIRCVCKMASDILFYCFLCSNSAALMIKGEAFQGVCV